jgi:hypothetical protein
LSAIAAAELLNDTTLTLVELLTPAAEALDLVEPSTEALGAPSWSTRALPATGRGRGPAEPIEPTGEGRRILEALGRL